MSGGGLQHEIGKRDPFDLHEEEAYLNLLRTTSLLSNEVARLFRSHHLSEGGYNALRILRGAGPDGRTCGEISHHLVARVPDVTRLVDRLVAAGYAGRNRLDHDRRCVRVTITPLGLHVLAALDEPIRNLLRRLFVHLTQDELGVLSALLVAARRSLTPPSH